MNDASVKAILVALVDEVESLRASQGVAIATLQTHLKITASAAATAIDKTKFSNRTHYDKLRKAIDEISS